MDLFEKVLRQKGNELEQVLRLLVFHTSNNY
jgi:hypothetical protein